MIKYILKCHNEHEFESWFSNSDEFEKLNNKNLLECIYCSSKILKNQLWLQWFRVQEMRMKISKLLIKILKRKK